MSPRLGQIVIYRLAENVPDSDGVREFPGIITRIWTEDCVNLRVFMDDERDVCVTPVPLLPADRGEPRTCWPAE
jgi:hypothetical protein